jgi:hypothetical protein
VISEKITKLKKLGKFVGKFGGGGGGAKKSLLQRMNTQPHLDQNNEKINLLQRKHSCQ